MMRNMPPSTLLLLTLAALLLSIPSAQSQTTLPSFYLVAQPWRDGPPPPGCNPPLPPASLTGPPGTYPLFLLPWTQLAIIPHGPKFVVMDTVSQSYWSAFTSYTPNLKPYITIPGVPALARCASGNPAQDAVNGNIAQAFAILRISELVLLFPPGIAVVTEAVASVLKGTKFTVESGRKYSDLSTPCDCASPDAPACIGTQAAFTSYQKIVNSGWNIDGKKTPSGIPYADYSGFKPVNRYDKLVKAARWQPLLETDGMGYFGEQQCDTPFTATTVSATWLTDKEKAARNVAPYKMGKTMYKFYVDQTLNLSASLDDKSKMMTEFLGITPVILTQTAPVLAAYHKWSPAKLNAYLLGASLFHDGHLLVMKGKIKHNAVRPMTAVRYIYGNQLVTAYSKVDGAVKKIPANQWLSYLSTPHEQEYPSGGACLSMMFAQWTLLFTKGTDDINQTFDPPLQYSFNPGCSYQEPGRTPSKKIEGMITTGKEFVELTKLARMQAGIHFQPGVDEGAAVCKGVAKIAFDKLRAKSGAF